MTTATATATPVISLKVSQLRKAFAAVPYTSDGNASQVGVSVTHGSGSVEVTFAGTDMDTYVIGSARIPADDGASTVHMGQVVQGSALRTALTGLSGTVEVQVTDYGVRIGHTVVPASGGELPEWVEDWNVDGWVILSGTDVAWLASGAGRDPGSAISGVSFGARGAWSTNRYLAHRVTYAMEDSPVCTVIPAKVLGKLVRSPKTVKTVHVGSSASVPDYAKVQVIYRDGVVITAVVSALLSPFPNMDNLVPSGDTAHWLWADASELTAAAKAAAKAKSPSVWVSASDAGVAVRSVELERVGDVRVNVPVPSGKASDTWDIRVNPDYLATVSAGMQGVADVRLREGSTPLVFTDDSGNRLAILMPVR